MNEDMVGHYDVIYSPYDCGFYASLWWKDEEGPVFHTIREAYDWAISKGGRHDHTKAQNIRVS